MFKSILITGSAGFIGSNLIRYLMFNEKKLSIIGMDKLISSVSRHNVYFNKSHDFYMNDVCDKWSCDRIFELRPECVIHLAENCLIQNNILGLINILDSCVSSKVSKFIYLSSSDVYKKNTSETDECYSSSVAIASKLSAESIITAYKEEYGLDCSILRIPVVFGYRQIEGFVPRIIKSFANNIPALLLNGGMDVIDLLYVEDLCTAISIICNNSDLNGIINVSANVDFTELEISGFIKEEFGSGNLNFDKIENKESNNIILNTSKIRSFGWKPNAKFKERLKQTVSWYKNNKWILT